MGFNGNASYTTRSLYGYIRNYTVKQRDCLILILDRNPNGIARIGLFNILILHVFGNNAAKFQLGMFVHLFFNDEFRNSLELII
ncbi:hypothetical protein D3C76_1601750 [compost metagenome]